MYCYRQMTFAAMAMGALLLANSAHSALIVYEGFQYSNVGDDLDQITTVDVDATGLTGSWVETFNNTESFLKAGSLLYSNLPVTGNHIGYLSNSNQDVFVRDFDATATTDITSANTIYFSFLFEKLQNNFGADREGMAILNGNLPNARWDNNNGGAVGRHGFAVAAVNGSNLQAVAYDGTAGTRVVSANSLPITTVNGGSNTSTSNQEVVLVVGEISYNTGTGGADVFSLYNVTDDGDLDASDLVLIDTIEANVDESTLTTLNLTRQVNVNWDEVRIGTTLDAVLGVDPIPEPSSIAMLLLSTIGMLSMLRRTR